jgi:hypothetical protein
LQVQLPTTLAGPPVIHLSLSTGCCIPWATQSDFCMCTRAGHCGFLLLLQYLVPTRHNLQIECEYPISSSNWTVHRISLTEKFLGQESCSLKLGNAFLYLTKLSLLWHWLEIESASLSSLGLSGVVPTLDMVSQSGMVWHVKVQNSWTMLGQKKESIKKAIDQTFTCISKVGLHKKRKKGWQLCFPCGGPPLNKLARTFQWGVSGVLRNLWPKAGTQPKHAFEAQSSSELEHVWPWDQSVGLHHWLYLATGSKVIRLVIEQAAVSESSHCV